MFQLHHVALTVGDLERSGAFYRALGFETVMQWRADDGHLRIDHLRLGPCILELFCFRDGPRARPAPNLDTDLPRPGLRHIALACDDLKEAMERLRDAGIPIETGITRGRTGFDYFFVRDPDGNFVEIVQDSRQLP